MLLLVISIILFITIFLPWWSWGVSYEGFHIGGSVNGFHHGGILTFLAALAGIALSFLEIPTPKYRSYAIIGIGVAALLGVLIAFAGYSGSSMGFGKIIALIVSIALIAVGYFDYRGIDILAKIKASSSSTPPPPPPPSTPPSPPPAPPTPPPSQPTPPPESPPPSPPPQSPPPSPPAQQ
jgi:hypothetical protein